ncbi:aminomethyltransferase family protein [Haloferacaceae archaeon DSL9]
MTLVGDLHTDFGATYTTRGGRRVVDQYGRPDRTHRAVRNGVGVIEYGYGIVVVKGDDRIDFVDNAISNRVPSADGAGCYALLLDPRGRIRTDMYVYNAGERLLLFTPPDQAEALVDDWGDKIFIQDVTLRDATTDFGVFGVHGPRSTEKVASVLNGAGAPEPPLTFVRGSMADAGVTVVASDNPTGEEGYEVVCGAADAPEVFDTLLTRGYNAVPFGYRTWDALTLEAGTPLFDTELRDRLPNVVGLRNAVDFEKGCFVGQEVVSKVENRGRPSRRLVGLASASRPDPGAAVTAGDDAGTITRAADSPTLDRAIAFALVGFDAVEPGQTIAVDGAASATVERLPFVSGSARSARRPSYGDDA